VITPNDIPEDRIREFLRHLPSQVRSSLLVEIERMQLYDEDIPGAAFILAELRAEFRKSGQSGDRIGNPSRYFFKPIEALFVDRSPERANSGQISRGSLSAIWEWINQILLPTMAREYCDRTKQLIVSNKPQEAELIAAGFQSKVVKSLEGILSTDAGVESVQHGLAKYTSSRAGFNDLRKVLAAFQMRNALVAFNEALPAKVDDLQGTALASIRTLLDGLVAKHPDALPFGLTMVTKRLKAPWQLLRLATEAAHGPDADDLAATRYAISVSMVLDQLDDKRLALHHALKSNRVPMAKGVLTEIYDIERAMRARIGRIESSDWGRRLDEVMAAVEADLRSEFDAMPGRLHHVLESIQRYQPAQPGLLNSLMLKGRNLIGLGHEPVR
jgi:hypothetical protein